MKNNKIRLPILLLSASILFSGCGSYGYTSTATEGFSEKNAKTEGNAMMAAEDTDYEESYGDAAYEDVMYEDAGNESDSAPTERKKEIETTQEEASSEEKLVYECSISIQTLTYPETLASIRKKIEDVSGIIQNEYEQDNDSNWYYDNYTHKYGTKRMELSVRIPSAKYKDFLSSLDGEGKIIDKRSSVSNISRQYHDTEAIIKNLKTQEERLQDMMKQTTTIDEMITVEDRLTEVQTELDRYNTQLASMDTDVAYSTVDITLEEVVKYSESEKPALTFVQRLKNAIKGSADTFRSLMETILFLIIYMAPIAAVIALIVFIVIKVRNRIQIKKYGTVRRKKKIKENANTIDRQKERDTFKEALEEDNASKKD